jgi:hypothetical protein
MACGHHSPRASRISTGIVHRPGSKRSERYRVGVAGERETLAGETHDESLLCPLAEQLLEGFDRGGIAW